MKDETLGKIYYDACAKELKELGSDVRIGRVEGKEVGATLAAAQMLQDQMEQMRSMVRAKAA